MVGIRMVRAKRAKEVEDAAADAVTAIRLDAEDLTADRLPEDQWLALAERALSEQNPRLALRAFYLAKPRVDGSRIHQHPFRQDQSRI